MDFIELIMTVCLLSAPEQCEEKRQQFTSQYSIHQCIFEAPLFIAQWTGDHPRWTVARWHCAFPGSEGDKT